MQLKARIISALRTFPKEIQQANSELLEQTVKSLTQSRKPQRRKVIFATLRLSVFASRLSLNRLYSYLRAIIGSTFDALKAGR